MSGFSGVFAETERLFISDINESDYENVTKLFGDSKIREYAFGIFEEISDNSVKTRRIIANNKKTGFNLVAKTKDKNEFIGFLRGDMLKKPDAAWVYSLAIAAHERRKGYGTELVKAFEKYLRACTGADFIGLSVLESNIEGINFWEAIGYELKETLVKSALKGDGLSKINIYVKLF